MDGVIAMAMFLLLKRFQTGIQRFVLRIYVPLNVGFNYFRLDTVVNTIIICMINTGALAAYVPFPSRFSPPSETSNRSALAVLEIVVVRCLTPSGAPSLTV